MRLSSNHIEFRRFYNPSNKFQTEFMLEHFGYIPSDYEYISHGSIEYFHNKLLNEVKIGTFTERNGKTDDGRRVSKIYVKESA